jgi:hypothetical protein
MVGSCGGDDDGDAVTTTVCVAGAVMVWLSRGAFPVGFVPVVFVGSEPLSDAFEPEAVDGADVELGVGVAVGEAVTVGR